MGTPLKKYNGANEYHKIIDIFHMGSRIRPNMFRDHASILMEAKSKRKPTFTTSVVGSGHVSVKQEIGKHLP